MTTEQLRQYWPEWEIDAELGVGSFGTVYRIKRAMFGEKIQFAALKVIYVPKNQVEVRQLQSEGMDDKSVSAYFQSFVQNLSDEIDLLSRLKGTSNIVSYEDHKIIADEGMIGWTILIRMELLTPLNDYLRQRPMSQDEVLRLGLGISKALELCEKNRIIHRDIKPDNIFISPNRDFKLGDFGVARELEKTTMGLSRKGTFNYMAPEVFHGRPYNATADIYSLGIVLYRLLNNNRTPFLPSAPQPISYNDREQAQQLLLSGTSIPPLTSVPTALNDIVLKMCAHHPGDRYQSAAELLAALESVKKSTVVPSMPKVEVEDEPADIVIPVFMDEPIKAPSRPNVESAAVIVPRYEDEPTDVFDDPDTWEEPTFLQAEIPIDEPTDVLDYPAFQPPQPPVPKKKKHKSAQLTQSEDNKAKKARTKAIVGFVLALVGLVLGSTLMSQGIIAPYGILFGIAGIVLSSMGLKSKKKGLAIAGLISCIIITLITIVTYSVARSDISVPEVTYSVARSDISVPERTTATTTTTSTRNETSRSYQAAEVLVDNISISPSQLDLEVGKIDYVSASVSPYNATNKDIEWSSDDTSVATVDEYGRVTAVATGSTWINAKAKDGSWKRDYIKVKVTAPEPKAGSVSSIKVYGPTTIKVGETAEITFDIYDIAGNRVPAGTTLTGRFSEGSILAWDVWPKVKGVSPGTVTITYTVDSDTSITDKIQITVVE